MFWQFSCVCEKSLCVVGLAPTHVTFKDKGGVTSVDFNVGKSDRSGIKVTGKRKKVITFWLILCDWYIGTFGSLGTRFYFFCLSETTYHDIIAGYFFFYKVII